MSPVDDSKTILRRLRVARVKRSSASVDGTPVLRQQVIEGDPGLSI